MVALYKAFCREVLQIEPQPRLACLLVGLLLTAPARLHSVAQVAAKSLYQHIGSFVRQICRLQRALPRQHGNACVPRWGNPLQGAGVIKPQAHTLAALCQINRQPPTHAHIPIVVDNGTTNLPKQGAVGGWDGRGERGKRAAQSLRYAHKKSRKHKLASDKIPPLSECGAAW